jgi:two-component system chemotaxis response regulator CheB
MPSLRPPAPSVSPPPRRPIRTLVAEDSATARALLVAILSSEPEIDVVGEATDGADAVRKAVALTPDLITMDVYMPVIDGLDATKAIMREAPTPILVVTAISSRDVELSLNAMQAGALMVVEKPQDPADERFARQREELLDMVKAMAGVKVVRQWHRRGTPPLPVTPQRQRRSVARLIAIGTSTGGPAALRHILAALPGSVPVPILVVQHIAPGFIDGLARWLGHNCALDVRVAVDGESLRTGVVYLAPDDHHLGVSSDGRVRLSDTSPVGGFRPSADYLFDSCGTAYGADLIAVVLTGMGRDGVAGLQAVHASGGRVLAQDESTSVVYGMAHEAVLAGMVDELLPLGDIAGRLLTLVS